ncbi:MAG: glucose 1-dehydrogenase [Deltaproteobacteria bacterium]|nr:glucose 1-dehydrogenase [Deltaproteobacteria bacterium]
MEPSIACRLLLPGQTAIVTGGGSGIGASIAQGLGAAGAKVVVNYSRTNAGAEEVVQNIVDQGGKALAFKADVSREEEVQALFKTAIQEFGTVDILVSNAGIQKDAPFLEMLLDDWLQVLNINLTGAFLCAREAAREFRRRGVVPERSRSAGKIIFISSVHEVIPWSRHVNYAASKGGIMLFMKSLAQELAPYKIRVNSIAPGAIRTRINRGAWETPEAEANLLKLIPYGRVGDPVDIANAAVWLASDESDYVHGTTLFVDGGMTLYPAFAEGG